MDTTHRCTEKECPFVGQVTSKSCRCHKTAEQMLSERVAELEAALEQVRDWIRRDLPIPTERATTMLCVVRDALAKSGA